MPEQGSAKPSDDRRPLWYGVAAGIVILSLAVGYRVIRTDGAVDFSGGVDGIQIKISEAEKAIESAQREMSAAQQQLEERDAMLKKSEQALREREVKVQQLLASLTPTASAGAKLTPKQARVELDELHATPLITTPPAAMAVKPRLERLEELRGSLHKTSIELNATRPAAAP